MLITVYDPEGNPHTVDPVDAREYLASGHYTQAPRTAKDKTGETKTAEDTQAEQLRPVIRGGTNARHAPLIDSPPIEAQKKANEARAVANGDHDSKEESDAANKKAEAAEQKLKETPAGSPRGADAYITTEMPDGGKPIGASDEADAADEDVKMTVAELRETLLASGVVFDDHAKKAELQALLQEFRAKSGK